MNNTHITLLNGKQLECFQGETFVGRSYQRIFKEENENMPLFEHVVWFLLDNADKIMADSKMFLCPMYSQVFSPFFSGMPRLGTFIEWWIHHPEKSRDNDGNPIFCISGNPMTGSHACYSISREGKTRKVTERGFDTILSSFGKVNSLYKGVKEDCEYYEFDEVVRLLSGESYDLKMELIRTKIILERTQGWYNTTKGQYAIVYNRFKRLLKDNKKLQLNYHKEDIQNFSSRYLPLEKEYNTEYENFVKERRKLRERLKEGLSEEEYRKQLNTLGKPHKEIRKQLVEMSDKFMKETFGKNPNEISFDDVIRYAKGKPIKYNQRPCGF